MQRFQMELHVTLLAAKPTAYQKYQISVQRARLLLMEIINNKYCSALRSAASTKGLIILSYFKRNTHMQLLSTDNRNVALFRIFTCIDFNLTCTNNNNNKLFIMNCVYVFFFFISLYVVAFCPCIVCNFSMRFISKLIIVQMNSEHLRLTSQIALEIHMPQQH